MLQYTSVIGPWRLNNEVQRRRAEFHANETHQIHLDMFGEKIFKVPTQNSVLLFEFQLLSKYHMDASNAHAFF